MYIYNNPKDFIDIFKTCKLCSNKIIDEKEDKYIISNCYTGNLFYVLNMKKIYFYKNNLIIDKIESEYNYKKNYYGDNNIVISHSCIFNITYCLRVNIVISEKTNSIKRVIPYCIDFFEPFKKIYYSLFKFSFDSKEFKIFEENKYSVIYNNLSYKDSDFLLKIKQKIDNYYLLK